MAFTNVIDTSTPVGTDTLTQGDNEIRGAKAGWQEFLNIDHVAGLTGTQITAIDSGCHNKVTLIEQSVDPTAPTGVTTDFGILYTKEDADTSQAEVFYIDENDNVLQITKGNSINLDSIFLSNNTFLDAENNAGDDFIDMIKVNASDNIEIGTATNDTVVAGDLTVTGALGASLDAGGNKINTLAEATTAGDAVRYEQLFTGLSGGTDSTGETQIGDLQLKWGKKTVSGQTDVDFTTEGLTDFDNACFQVIACSGKNNGTGGEGIHVYSLGVDGFSMNFETAGNVTPVRWFAIGR